MISIFGGKFSRSSSWFKKLSQQGGRGYIAPKVQPGGIKSWGRLAGKRGGKG